MNKNLIDSIQLTKKKYRTREYIGNRSNKRIFILDRKNLQIELKGNVCDNIEQSLIYAISN
jgi:hypothetical protein